LGLPYVSLLTGLIAATNQDDHPVLADSVANPIAWSNIDTEFTNSAADRYMVAKVAFFDATKPGQDGGSCALVTQLSNRLLKDLRVGHAAL
jgi:hypothetical protein